MRYSGSPGMIAITTRIASEILVAIDLKISANAKLAYEVFVS